MLSVLFTRLDALGRVHPEWAQYDLLTHMLAGLHLIIETDRLTGGHTREQIVEELTGLVAVDQPQDSAQRHWEIASGVVDVLTNARERMIRFHDRYLTVDANGFVGRAELEEPGGKAGDDDRVPELGGRERPGGSAVQGQRPDRVGVGIRHWNDEDRGKPVPHGMLGEGGPPVLSDPDVRHEHGKAGLENVRGGPFTEGVLVVLEPLGPQIRGHRSPHTRDGADTATASTPT